MAFRYHAAVLAKSLTQLYTDQQRLRTEAGR